MKRAPSTQDMHNYEEYFPGIRNIPCQAHHAGAGEPCWHPTGLARSWPCSSRIQTWDKTLPRPERRANR